MKVKGFQVAPAELEGHLLDYSDVADACVVGVPDAYSGEAPFAFVVLKAEAAKRAGASKEGAEAVRRSIIKVSVVLVQLDLDLTSFRILCSMCRTIKSRTSV